MFDVKIAAHLAELSKIKFTETELAQITKEMDEIIVLMDTVSDFDSTKSSETGSAIGLDKIRADIPKASLPRKDILKNAAEKDEKAFTVPKVV